MIGYLENRLSFLDKLYSPSNKEVYTPLALVNEILDKLPEQVWNNINFKWLNPAVKNGVFLGAIILRLIKNYLEKGIFNTEQEAYDHVVQNQIYGYALSRGALRTANKLIYGSAKYKGNIIYGNILEEQIDMKFDVVIGNPPYQKSTGSKHKIYPHFINKAVDVVKENGIVSLIVPIPGVDMLLGRSASQVKLKHSFKNIKYLAIDTPSNYFKEGSSFSYFVLENSNVDRSNTTIEFFDDNSIKIKQLNIKNGDFIPNRISDITLSIIRKVINNQNEFGRSVSRINDHGETGKYEVITKINKKGIFRKKTNSTHKDLNSHKVIFGISGHDYLIVKDVDMIMNGSSACCYVTTESISESKNLVSFLNSKLINVLFTKIFDLYQNKNYYALQWCKKVDLSIQMTDENIYNYFNLAQEEIDYIEANV